MRKTIYVYGKERTYQRLNKVINGLIVFVNAIN
jgi:hypothetical protein